MKGMKVEVNDAAYRAEFRKQIIERMAKFADRFKSFDVFCDESNNTPFDEAQKELHFDIYIHHHDTRVERFVNVLPGFL